MYFPYFYGRQSEVLAVRELAGAFGSPQQIWPVIEPVTDAASLVGTLKALRREGAAVYLIVNPDKHELATATQRATWGAAVGTYLADPTLVRPTLLVSAMTNAAFVRSFVATYRGRNVGVVLTGNDVAPADLATALGGSSAVVFLGRHSNRAAYESALGIGSTVDIEDNFVKKDRNLDYSGDDSQGTNHLTWSGAGKAGFSDYTVLPGTFSAKGGPMGALAIHLTYNAGAELRAQHFVSSTSLQTDPLPPKFSEAISALQAQMRATPTRFNVSPGITKYVDMQAVGVYTSAPGNKKQQIIHHLHEVGVYLGV